MRSISPCTSCLICAATTAPSSKRAFVFSVIIRPIVTPDCSDYNSAHVAGEINAHTRVLRVGGRGPAGAEPGLRARTQGRKRRGFRRGDGELPGSGRAQLDSQGVCVVAPRKTRACDRRSRARARTLATTARDRAKQFVVRHGSTPVEREFF